MLSHNLRYEELKQLSVDGERLRLVGIDKKYVFPIFKEFDAEVAALMSAKPAETLAGTIAYVEACSSAFSRREMIQLVILAKEQDEFLGCCGLYGADQQVPEVGVWLKRSAHGHAYGLEAVKTLTLWAQKNIKSASLLYPVDTRNKPSIKIPVALGAAVIGERAEENWRGEMLNLTVYEIPLAAQPQ